MKPRIIFAAASVICLSGVMAPTASAHSNDDHGKQYNHINIQDKSKDKDRDHDDQHKYVAVVVVHKDSDNKPAYKHDDKPKPVEAPKHYEAPKHEDNHNQDCKPEAPKPKPEKPKHEKPKPQKPVIPGQGGGVVIPAVTPVAAPVAPVAAPQGPVLPEALPRTGSLATLLIPAAFGLVAAGYVYLRRKRTAQA